MKKLAAPGRRGSTKPRPVFKPEGDIVETIDTVPLSQPQVAVNKEAEDRERERIAVEEAARERERVAAEEAAREKERVAAEEAARERERIAAEEAAREKERIAAEEAARERERVAAEEAARERERVAAEEAARERERVAAEEAARERERVAAEEAAREKERIAAEEAAREKERIAAEEAARERERIAAEEAARERERVAAEEAARERERVAAEEAAREKERIAAEEAARERERIAAEEAAREKERIAAEEAARERERVAAEEAAREKERIAAEELEKARADAEAETQRILEAEAEAAAEVRKQQALEEEERKMRAEALRAEQERIAEEAAAAEKERVRRQKQEAAAAKSKRDAFLSDMDSFSDSFMQKQVEKESAMSRAKEAEPDILTSSLSSASSAYRAPASRPAAQQNDPEPTQPETTDLQVPPAHYSEEGARPVSAPKGSAKPETAEKFTAAATALFSQLDNNETETQVQQETKNAEEEEEETEVLRLPTRSVNVKKQKKTTSTETDSKPQADTGETKVEEVSSPSSTSPAENKKSSILDRVKGGLKGFGSPKEAASQGRFSDDEDDDEDDDDDDANMTEKERAAWRAKQQDLTIRRKEFHGAVTYAFGGVFAWQMYSAVDAIDEYGKPYTEYLMRCQWGTTWENMQPWLVARRFREFDALNELLQRHFPKLREKMFPLPKKLLFGSLQSETIDQRTKDIEEYMATIITNIPNMLKSRYIDDFFGISARLKTIRAQLEEMSRNAPPPAPEEENPFTGIVPLAPGTVEEMGLGKESRERAQSQEEKKQETVKTLELEDLMTEEDVNALCTAQTPPFDSDELGQMEEYITRLRQLLRKTRAKNIPTDPKIRKMIDECQSRWSRLHSTSLIDPDGARGGVMLIPRAMQAEEELEGAIKELRSLLIAQSMGSPLHF